MRIVDVNPFFHPWRGGIESRMYDTSRLLAAKGHDVTVVAAQIYDDAPDEEEVDGFRIVRLKSRRLGTYNPPFVSSAGISEAIESLDPDVVNFNYRWAPSYTRALGRYDGAKVFTYHNMWGEGVGALGRVSGVNDGRFAKTLDTFDHIIAVSDTVRDDLIRRGYSERYITCVPSCLSTPIDPGKGDGDFILSLGRLVRTKGLDCLVEAMRDVDHRLVICGRGPDARRLGKEIRRAGVSDRVEMRGHVSEEEKRELMGSCRFFVMPSVFESLGLAAVEMLARGRPVVCSDADGLPETVGEGGVVVPKGDPKALAGAMNALWDDRGRCEELAAKAAERARFYDWGIHLPKIEEVYSKAVSGEYSEADAHRAG